MRRERGRVDGDDGYRYLLACHHGHDSATGTVELSCATGGGVGNLADGGDGHVHGVRHLDVGLGLGCHVVEERSDHRLGDARELACVGREERLVTDGPENLGAVSWLPVVELGPDVFVDAPAELFELGAGLGLGLGAEPEGAGREE